MHAAQHTALPAGVELGIYKPPLHGPLRENFFAAFAFLVREFVGELAQLKCPLATFQGIDEELSGLPGKYGADEGGCMWLLAIPMHLNGESVAAVAGWPAPLTLHLGCLGAHAVLGCVALRALAGRPDAREVKRLIVTARARGMGGGRALLRAAEGGAREAGAEVVMLDSLERLKAAGALYAKEGWERAPPYCYNPMEDALFFQKKL
jgi:GNAT superfamily N-acetyltransferase